MKSTKAPRAFAIEDMRVATQHTEELAVGVLGSLALAAVSNLDLLGVLHARQSVLVVQRSHGALRLGLGRVRDEAAAARRPRQLQNAHGRVVGVRSIHVSRHTGGAMSSARGSYLT